MNAAQHTPGDWTVRESYHYGDGETPTGLIIDSPTLMVITGMPAAAMPVEEMLANGRLMAAAPRLLRAADAALKKVNDPVLVPMAKVGMEDLRVAIALARYGYTEWWDYDPESNAFISKPRWDEVVGKPKRSRRKK